MLNKPLIPRVLFIDLLWGIVSEPRAVQIRELKAEARAYSKLGEYKKSKKSILRAIDLDPSSKHLRHELAKISIESKNFEEALAILLELKSQVSNKKILYKDLGLAYLGMGKLEKALHYSNESLSENHNYAEAHFLKGQALRQLEKYDEAIEEFDKVLSKESENRDALYQKGKIFHILGKYRESLNLFDKVLEFRPRDTEVLAAKGRSHDELDEYKEASESLSKSLSVEDEVIYNDRGEKMVATKKRSLAKTISWRVIATTDTLILAWLFTSDEVIAASIAGLEVVTKLVLYYVHERGWSSLEWGQEN